jgi:histidyl-tRNA synthetase
MNNKNDKSTRTRARLPKGMRDIEPAEIRAMGRMLDTIRTQYELYGFEPLDTPTFEYTDALGKFLPDQDRPNEGVFSLQDEDEEWLSLRYDLTAPLARYVALNFDALPKPYRRYQTGFVYRNEKPGPGRFRQFTQFDADTVGAPVGAADAEMCMLAADTMEALGIARGDYVIRVNNRKVLDGLMESIGLAGEENATRRLLVLRALDKLDKFPVEEVKKLLGEGRKDESGDYTPGANLTEVQIAELGLYRGFVMAPNKEDDIPVSQFWEEFLLDWEGRIGSSEVGREGLSELGEIAKLVTSAGYGYDRIRIDPSVVRGLEYYTGPVFEAELTFEVKDDKGQKVRFGSVGGGGRYDGLIARFKGQEVPATGFSIGVSRLYAALAMLGKHDTGPAGPVIVLVMDKDGAALGGYQAMVQELRAAGIRAELYVGGAGMKAQMKYADKRGAPCVIIQGSNERDKGEVTIKDLIEGAKAAREIADHQSWRDGRPAQFTVPRGELVEAVRLVLARHTPDAAKDDA